MLRNGILFLLVILAGYAIGKSKTEVDHACAEGKQDFAPLDYSAETNGNVDQFDVKFYELSLILAPDSNSVGGSLKMLAEVIDSSLNEIEIHFLEYSSVPQLVGPILVNGDTLDFTHTDRHILVALDTAISMGVKFELKINWVAGPFPRTDNLPLNFDQHFGEDLIWTLSAGFRQYWWWPCKSWNYDKPDSMSIYITVPEDLHAAANGVLRSKIINGDGTTTFNWHVSYPIAPYLVGLSIYPYFFWEDQYVSSKGDTMPLVFYTYYDSANTPSTTKNYLKTKHMIAGFATLFGEYPFIQEKYGHMQVDSWANMEHQTISTLNTASETIIAHELAHQWWGNMITCYTMHDLWLNEGFATYSEALWKEYAYGEFEYYEFMAGKRYLGLGSIYIEDYSKETIWDYGLRYQKSAWILHMLRHVVTDSVFFDILRTYGDHPDHKYKTATTDEFRAICEDVSGMDLKRFFNQWIYGEYHPKYLYGWFQKEDTLVVQIEQVQPWGGLFWMPVDLELSFGDSTVTMRVINQHPIQQYFFHIPSSQRVTDVQLDPESWILRTTKLITLTSTCEQIPLEYDLSQNHPNPFNPHTTISYDLPEHSKVNLTIYDVQGRELIVLQNQAQPAGHYEMYWNGYDDSGKQVSTGVYFARLQAEDYSKTIKMLYLK